MGEGYAFSIRTGDEPGILHLLTGVFAAAGANIRAVEILPSAEGEARILFEVSGPVSAAELVTAIEGQRAVREVTVTDTASAVFGKRIVVLGGGAQVGQVASAAIAEADRHNIRGERISIDTIPLVGEAPLAGAVRALARLPRVRLVVLAGSLMGGDITRAVEEVRAQGLLVIALNMAGSVPDAADLVVTDPVQAGVMAVMAVADTAQFDLGRQRRRRY